MKKRYWAMAGLLVVTALLLTLHVTAYAAPPAQAEQGQIPRVISFAVTQEGGYHFVWRLWSDGKIEQRQVTKTDVGGWRNVSAE